MASDLTSFDPGSERIKLAHRRLAAAYARKPGAQVPLMIGEVFGGVHVHSCGDYRHNIDNVLDIANVRSIQVHAGPGEFILPESPDEDCPFNRARKQVAVYVDTNQLARGTQYKNRPKLQYEEYVLPRLGNDLTGVILQSCGTGEDMPDAAAAIAWTRTAVNG